MFWEFDYDSNCKGSKKINDRFYFKDKGLLLTYSFWQI